MALDLEVLLSPFIPAAHELLNVKEIVEDLLSKKLCTGNLLRICCTLNTDPEPVFETKLIFSPRFVELSSQGLFLNVKIRVCATTGPYPGGILDGLGHVTFPGHFHLPCLP